MNFYELLDVPTHATGVELKKAYDVAMEAYGEQAVAGYSVLPEPERKAYLRKVEEAYKVLSDPVQRQSYDRWLKQDGGAGEYNVVPLSVEHGHAQGREQESPLDPGEALRQAGRIDGMLLKAIRQSMGVALKDIAEKTKISIMYLKFIEENEFQALPAPVYLRGFLQQYARILKVEEKAVVEGYLKTYNQFKLQQSGGSEGEVDGAHQ